MRALVQRTTGTTLSIGGVAHAKTGPGLCVFLGIRTDDTPFLAEKMAQKLVNLRIFCDEADKMNRCLLDTGGEILLVSQFTLYADCSHGRRPAFLDAARPEIAVPLYEQVIALLRQQGVSVQTGVFGADMQVSLVNDGPVTIWLDTDDFVKLPGSQA